MKATIAVLPGDGIGPEVVGQATALLSHIAAKYGHEFNFAEGLIGGIAIDETGAPLPAETIALCQACDAILLGAVGGPKWSDPTASVQPERGTAGAAAAFWLIRQPAPCEDISRLGRSCAAARRSAS